MAPTALGALPCGFCTPSAFDDVVPRDEVAECATVVLTAIFDGFDNLLQV